MSKNKRIWILLVAIVCAFTMLVPSSVEAATIKLNAKSKTIEVGKTTTLKVSGTSKKVTWSSSNKKIATVSSKGKVKGIKAGTCTIKAKVGGKTYKCKVKVKKASTSKGITKEQAQADIEAACRAHGLVSYPEYVNQLIASGEYDESERAELMSWVHEASWFQTKARIDGKDSGEFPGEFEGSPAYTIEYVRTDGDYYIFTCYTY